MVNIIWFYELRTQGRNIEFTFEPIINEMPWYTGVVHFITFSDLSLFW